MPNSAPLGSARAAIPVELKLGKLRTVLDYLPCDACLTVPTEDQETLCSVCHRLHREVAVKLVERRAVIVETPAPPPEALSEIAPASPSADLEPVVPVVGEPEPVAGRAEVDEDDAFGFEPAAAEAEDDVGFDVTEEEGDDGFEVSNDDVVEDVDLERVPPEELERELLELAESTPDFAEGEFTFAPPSKENASVEMAESEILELEEEEWMPEEETRRESPADGWREAPVEEPQDSSVWAPRSEREALETVPAEEDAIVESEVVEEEITEMEVLPDEEEVVDMAVLEDEAVQEDDPPIEALEGVGAAYASRLNEAGISRVRDLAGRDPWALAETTGISGKALERWVLAADLVRAGVPKPYAEALSRTSVKSLEGFLSADPERAARDANLFLKGTEASPATADMVRAWQRR